MNNKNKYSRAIGLEYSLGQDLAPQVSLQSDALDADEVVRIARRFGIPVVEKPKLVEALERLSLDQEIPESLYEAVALVLNELENKTSKI